MATINKKCPSCKKIVIVEWHQAFGMRLLTEVNRKDHYSAKCPLCKYEWFVKK